MTVPAKDVNGVPLKAGVSHQTVCKQRRSLPVGNLRLSRDFY
jgi:hypothetical protein